MPGLAGIINATGLPTVKSDVQRMVGCMVHEDFFGTGLYHNHELGVALGWTGFRDGPSGKLEAWNEDKSILLVCIGEVFADELRTQSENQIGRAAGSNLGRGLISLYEDVGLRFVEKLNGWFCGVLVDLRQKKAVLFNDRFGLQRVYYHESDRGLYFSTEAKALLKLLPQARQIDTRGLAEACACGCVLQGRTLFSKVFLLPGASTWTLISGQRLKKESYFRPAAWEHQASLDGRDYYKELKATFARVLPKYFRDAERMGMSLTGGLDGRMIMAWMAQPPGSFPCYTFGGTYRDCTDVRMARMVAKVCGQAHQVIPVDGDFLTEFPRLAERAVYISDGAMDVTGSVELYVNKIVRGIAPIRMTGNYGSEILRGNIAFKPKRLNDTIYSPEFVVEGGHAAATYAMEATGHPVSFIGFKQVPWHHYSRLSLEQSQLAIRSPYLDNELVALMYRAPRELLLSKTPSLRLIGEGNSRLTRIPTDRGLVYPSRPLLTWARHSYEEFTFRAEYAYDYGMPQELARIDHLLAPFHLERLFLGRHKFSHFRIWYRDKLSDYVRGVVLDSRTRNRPFLNGKRLEPMVQGHLRGNRNYTTEIHKVLTCELIHRELIERNWERE